MELRSGGCSVSHWGDSTGLPKEPLLGPHLGSQKEPQTGRWMDSRSAPHLGSQMGRLSAQQLAPDLDSWREPPTEPCSGWRSVSRWGERTEPTDSQRSWEW